MNTKTRALIWLVLATALVSLAGCAAPKVPTQPPAPTAVLTFSLENVVGTWQAEGASEFMRLDADETAVFGKTLQAVASGNDVVYGRFRLGTEAALMGIRDDTCDTEGRYNVTVTRQGDGSLRMQLRAADDPCGSGARKAKLETPWIRVGE